MTAKSVPTAAEKRTTYRRERYDARGILWRESHLSRVQVCGKHVQNAEAGFTVKVTDGTAGFGGIQSCGSVWACPVCSEKINRTRQAELTTGLEAWQASGRGIVMATFTLSHHVGQSLAELWDAVSPSFRKVVAGRAWVGEKPTKNCNYRVGGDREEFGVKGFVRLIEVTHGASGWHPHLHVLFFTETVLTAQERETFRARLFGRWERALKGFGQRTLEADWKGVHVGVDVRPVTDAAYVAEYFAKHGYRPAVTSAAGAAFEVTGSHAKRAGAGRTPFEILADVVKAETVDEETGELVPSAADLRLWHEWELTSKGRRQLTWSRGLRDLLGLGVELEDEAVVEEDHGGDVVIQGTASQYRALSRAHVLVKVLELAEADPSGDRLVRWLGRRGIHDVRALTPPRERASLFDVA